jgi:hypothetical protein
MMRLNTSDASLTLAVERYQFPDADPKEWDAAWVVVSGAVKCPRGNWTFQDPCLTASELATLASWMRHVAPLAENDEISFMEPCLRFWCDGESPPGTLFVSFSHEACPPWSDQRFTGGETISFSASVDDLLIAAAQLEQLSLRYPDRMSADAG